MKSCFINYVRLGDSILQVFIMASLYIHCGCKMTPPTVSWSYYQTQTTGSSVTKVTSEQLLSVSQWACYWDALFKEGSLRDRAAKEHAIQIWNVNTYILCFCCNFLLRENLTFQDLPLHFNWWQIPMQ